MRPATLEEMLQARSGVSIFAKRVISAAMQAHSVPQIMEIMLRFKREEITLPQMATLLFPNEMLTLAEQKAWNQQLCNLVASTLREQRLLQGSGDNSQTPCGLWSASTG